MSELPAIYQGVESDQARCLRSALITEVMRLMPSENIIEGIVHVLNKVVLRDRQGNRLADADPGGPRGHWDGQGDEDLFGDQDDLDGITALRGRLGRVRRRRRDAAQMPVGGPLDVAADMTGALRDMADAARRDPLVELLDRRRAIDDLFPPEEAERLREQMRAGIRARLQAVGDALPDEPPQQAADNAEFEES